jgi:hypothetical protein
MVTQQKVARVKSFGHKPRTVARDKKPVADLSFEQLDAAQRWKFATEL